ncbi:M61 family metallopeptidase [Fibrivirga algicola]|uniref:M61 family metallopeptidase n=1 Tax=Fibrivirga algicola TaxID=2950420 RepID=A0ABX0QCS1_9BACT|nr:M61 family metallopeptidase [Fibrivirga algicola]NID10196.1 M61 family metallopeptidase [Fibrivirga algicola]
MLYTLSVAEPGSHYINVTCRIDEVTGDTLELQLPAWRPGRYELQHFAKNIRSFAVFDQDDQPLTYRKVTKDRWQVQTKGATSVQVRYDYFGLVAGDHKLDAGSSYADSSHFWYINPVNLCLYAEGRLHEACTLALDIPDGWQIACGLPQQNTKTLIASDYYALVDSPLIASGTLQAVRYTVQDVAVTVWVQGWNYLMPPAFDPAQITADFTRFTEAQIKLFGDFPEADYHFLTLVLPVPYYHGVEHRNSTVLVLGPELEGLAADGETIEGAGLYTDLLGVASHELFHAWNICRIRPAELTPYDFTRENYFTTCFVAEGITTYYGDLMLRRSSVFDDAAYLKELLVILKRHFEQAGRASLSLTESSWDLWLDGYVRGVPDRKVSVYHKGAIASLILDLHLRRKFDHERSLDDVMRLLWQRFGATENGQPVRGYTYADYRAIVAEVADEPLDWYFDTCITGNVPIDELLNDYLSFIGLRMGYDDAGLVVLEWIGRAQERMEWERWFA